MLSDPPLVRIIYKEAGWVETAPGRYMKELHIADDDVKLVRVLVERNINIRLECPGRRTYHFRLRPLLKRLLPGPTKATWRVRVSGTGSLRMNNHVTNTDEAELP